MPYARIEIPTGRTREEKRALLSAVDAAFVATLGVPPNDAFLRLFEYAPEDVIVPSRHGARFTFIEVQLFPGRSPATKAALYRTLVDGLVKLGVPPADITIALIEISRQDWGIEGRAGG